MIALVLAESACARTVSTSDCPAPGLSSAPGQLPPYRGPLRWLAGAPTSHELLAGMALLVGGLILILLAWRLLKSYGRACLYEAPDPVPWQGLTAAICLIMGSALLWQLWHAVEQVAARMGIGVLVLLGLLAAETPERQRPRRTR